MSTHESLRFACKQWEQINQTCAEADFKLLCGCRAELFTLIRLTSAGFATMRELRVLAAIDRRRNP